MIKMFQEKYDIVEKEALEKEKDDEEEKVMGAIFCLVIFKFTNFLYS